MHQESQNTEGGEDVDSLPTEGIKSLVNATQKSFYQEEELAKSEFDRSLKHSRQ